MNPEEHAFNNLRETSKSMETAFGKLFSYQDPTSFELTLGSYETASFIDKMFIDKINFSERDMANAELIFNGLIRSAVAKRGLSYISGDDMFKIRQSFSFLLSQDGLLSEKQRIQYERKLNGRIDMSLFSAEERNGFLSKLVKMFTPKIPEIVDLFFSDTDFLRNSVDAYSSLKHFEFARNFSLKDHPFFDSVFNIREELYEIFSKEEQSVIDKVTKEKFTFFFEKYMEELTKGLKKVDDEKYLIISGFFDAKNIKTAMRNRVLQILDVKKQKEDQMKVKEAYLKAAAAKNHAQNRGKPVFSEAEKKQRSIEAQQRQTAIKNVKEKLKQAIVDLYKEVKRFKMDTKNQNKVENFLHTGIANGLDKIQKFFKGVSWEDIGEIDSILEELVALGQYEFPKEVTESKKRRKQKNTPKSVAEVTAENQNKPKDTAKEEISFKNKTIEDVVGLLLEQYEVEGEYELKNKEKFMKQLQKFPKDMIDKTFEVVFKKKSRLCHSKRGKSAKAFRYAPNMKESYRILVFPYDNGFELGAYTTKDEYERALYAYLDSF